MTKIETVLGRRVWDSRGRPTVEAEVRLLGGASGRAIAPAGASTGSGEAVDLRDGGTAQGGYDVRRAVENVSGPLADALRGCDATDQGSIDRRICETDATDNKSSLGANACIAVSMAVVHATAVAHGVPLYRHLAGDRKVGLPLPEIQIFGGGAHAGRRIDIQDLMVVCPGAATLAQALDWTADIYRAAGDLMARSHRRLGVADEGGHWPDFASNEEALEMLVRAIEQAGRSPGDDVVIALDIAASEFGRKGHYRLALDDRELDSEGMIEMLLRWIRRFPIRSLEDPLAEDDAQGFARLMEVAGDRLQIVGDDLLVTDADRVRRAAEDRTANTVLLKPNQRGTLTETLAAWQAARSGGMDGIVSARSGETEDTTIVDLAVGWGVPQLKVGSMARSERTAKWNALLRIEEREQAPLDRPGFL